MTDETGAPAGGEAISVVSAGADAPAELTMNHAAKALANIREKRNQSSAESAEKATAETELSGEDNAAPAEQATGETQEADPAERPSLDLPRSWTKDRTEHWAKLDPDTQAFLLEQDSKASAEVRRVQNEAAEERKAAQAERSQAEKARQQYEAQLPALMQALQDVHSQEFSDIKSMADVEKIAQGIKNAELAGDPLTAMQLQGYLTRWQVHQQKMASVKAELDQAEQAKTQKQKTEWQNYRNSESAKAAELVPDLADAKKGPELMAKAAKLLRDVQFSQDELNAIDGGEKISPFDHRMQSIIADAVRYRDIVAAKTAVAAKPLPPVQRPGTSKPQGSGASERVQALDNSLTNSGSLKAAQALLLAKRNAQRRAS